MKGHVICNVQKKTPNKQAEHINKSPFIGNTRTVCFFLKCAPYNNHYQPANHVFRMDVTYSAVPSHLKLEVISYSFCNLLATSSLNKCFISVPTLNKFGAEFLSIFFYNKLNSKHFADVFFIKTALGRMGLT